jgi:lambda family phage portal protein
MKNGKITLTDRIKGAAKILFGYDAVKNTRRRRNRGLEPLRAEEIELNSVDRARLISTLMNFKRNNPVVKAISRMKKSDVIGKGIVPQPQTLDDDFNDDIQRLWAEWITDCEVTATMDFTGVQKEIIDATLFQGDIGVLKTRGGKLQLIEGQRIGNQFDGIQWSENNPDKNGVVVNKSGKPTHYKVGERVNGSLQNVRNIPARDMLLYYKRIRPSQWRGVPELASCVNALQDVDEYEDIEMISAKVSASLSAVVKRENHSQFEIIDRLPADEQDTTGRLQRFEPGQFHYLEPGETVETISAHGRPNVDGIDWCTYRLRQVGAAVGVPVEMMLATIGQASFSASQGLVLLYQGAIEEEQRAIVPFLNKIYKWRLRKWLLSGDLEIPTGKFPYGFDPYKTRWQPPAFRWINRAQQVAADYRYLQMGALSLDDISSQFGGDAEQALRRKAQNIVTAKRLAKEYGLDNYIQLFNQFNVNASANFADILEPALVDQIEKGTTSTKESTP